jgi:hypothetical protein
VVRDGTKSRPLAKLQVSRREGREIIRHIPALSFRQRVREQGCTRTATLRQDTIPTIDKYLSLCGITRAARVAV